MKNSTQTPETSMDNKKPIGIFDSGLGGLTVLKEISAILPSEDAIYIGDTARVPYGIKSKETVTEYSRELSSILISKGVKAIVVACNTASAFALDALKKDLNIPVIGVIEPGARKAAATTKNKSIGVIGTEATIKSSAYSNAIKKIDSSITVTPTHCPLFVPLVEEGWTDNKISEEVAREYLSIYTSSKGNFKDITIDTLVLGCTHYPLLKTTISHIMGSDVKLIDSAKSTAEELKVLFEKEGLLNSKKEHGQYSFLATDSTERFISIGGKFFGEKLSKAELLKLK